MLKVLIYMERTGAAGSQNGDSAEKGTGDLSIRPRWFMSVSSGLFKVSIAARYLKKANKPRSLREFAIETMWPWKLWKFVLPNVWVFSLKIMLFLKSLKERILLISGRIVILNTFSRREQSTLMPNIDVWYVNLCMYITFFVISLRHDTEKHLEYLESYAISKSSILYTTWSCIILWIPSQRCVTNSKTIQLLYNR